MIILKATFYSLMVITNQLPYWFLAVKYWAITYSFEELIKPFDFQIRPKWHSYFEHAVTFSIVLLTILNGIVYGLGRNTEDHPHYFYISTISLVGVIYLVILSVLCHSLVRLK